ncbi:unnamed protein product [Phytophthora lilii]|uniref:Unnamed protein product n=1 Tax=Phytophthora lilii TaxID=2077276 RepID=A0A9W6U2S5_9STRA|nr:unnamed protein product [Phytophthora lilii]
MGLSRSLRVGLDSSQPVAQSLGLPASPLTAPDSVPVFVTGVVDCVVPVFDGKAVAVPVLTAGVAAVPVLVAGVVECVPIRSGYVTGTVEIVVMFGNVGSTSTVMAQSWSATSAPRAGNLPLMVPVVPDEVTGS